jgi:hypothetical protein
MVAVAELKSVVGDVVAEYHRGGQLIQCRQQIERCLKDRIFPPTALFLAASSPIHTLMTFLHDPPPNGQSLSR